MDYKSRDAIWLEKAQNIFTIESTQGTESSHKIALKKNIKNLMHKRTRIWWNKAFLQKYLASGLLPRGLRVQVFPSFPIEDNELKNKWEEACNKCSQSFLELLIIHNSQTLEILEKELEDTQKTFTKDCSKTEVETFNKELNENMNGWEKEIQEVKSKKYQRDSTDAQTNRVYKWRQNRNTNGTLRRTSSVSSIASTSTESASSSTYRHPHSNRKRKFEYGQNMRTPQKRRHPSYKEQNQN
ncbi:uncharacterized protein LOC130357474 [Hyla sarda]|uniref:uncharacterized protein LOC130357473 n=1 Tax=Hyla sarda TaxID=327740 RepID=UPI0024C401A6|nr:uncharacterized protein LOC130357473 [Hyla sarda]XP_056416144.1 uncharacterized protein LOC130357474 [Hyla sarda]